MKTAVLFRLALCVAAMSVTACAELGIYPASGPRTTGRVITQAAAPGASSRSTLTAGEARRLAVANGLTGRQSLPPGIQRNLARGKPLPPGIARQVVPGGMLGSLPTIDGHEWSISGTDLILIALGTLLVVEVLEDVFE